MSDFELTIHEKLFDLGSFDDSNVKACMTNLSPTDGEIITYLKTQPDGLVYLTKIADKYWKAMTFNFLREKKCYGSTELSEIYEFGITTLYLNLYEERYYGGDLKSYFTGICKNTWFNKLRKKLREPQIVPYEYEQTMGHSDDEKKSERQEILEKSLGEIGEPCRSVERLKFEEYRLEEIAEKLGMTLRRLKGISKECHDKFLKRLKENGYGK